MSGNHPRETTENILEVRDLVQSFSQPYGILDRLAGKPRKTVHAVNGVSFSIRRKEVFSLVGESGCGKSTTARTIVRLLEPRSGSVVFDGEDISAYTPSQMMHVRKKMQMIFQDPYASLNPRQRIKDIIMEPMLFHETVTGKEEAHAEMYRLLDIVGFRPEQAERYPHQFSGGQRQRIGIARALSTNPSFIVADEPVSALDVSIQAQVLNLLKELKAQKALTYIFITHDLSVVEYISDRIAVMYLGRIVELADAEELYRNTLHPYTKALLSAIPVADVDHKKQRILLEGDVPSPIDLPVGCSFQGRCPHCCSICREKRPEMRSFTVNGHEHQVACHLAESFLNGAG